MSSKKLFFSNYFLREAKNKFITSSAGLGNWAAFIDYIEFLCCKRAKISDARIPPNSIFCSAFGLKLNNGCVD